MIDQITRNIKTNSKITADLEEITSKSLTTQQYIDKYSSQLDFNTLAWERTSDPVSQLRTYKMKTFEENNDLYFRLCEKIKQFKTEEGNVSESEIS